ncbi:hypothetical protein AYO20_09199 [Fonsecaea nubica]|uniref:Major facilitator superfamily (MFS) profile domain-containing protein n=1 Tax=Fonsecaea nubica TaxID=856822 RepID=A0A178CK46_9EURO|nr:hypothetical protein AYO20_09199 [Fonsecaea nubica]OAL29462.1 hypothetical protein AYO20_09199 [Fonsecaea nubica]
MDEDKIARPVEVNSVGEQHIAIQTETFAIDEEALGNNLPKHYYRSVGFIGTVIALALGSISNLLGWSLPSNSLAIINADIGPSKNITWVALAYTLGLSVGFLIIGRLSDIFGRRWFFIGGNAFSLVGSIIGATATRVDSLIGANILNGLGGAVQISFTVAISELVPNKHRPLWISGIFLSPIEFAGFGPVIAQTLAEKTAAGWRWSYYLNIIVTGLAVILFFFCYHPPSFRQLHLDRSTRRQLARQDFVGLFLFTGGLIIFLMGLSWGGILYPWKSAHVIASIVVGSVVLVIFVVYDAKFHKGDALLPMRLFKYRGYLAMVLTAMVGSCVYYSMTVLWPQQISYLFGGSPTHRGWLACVVGASFFIGQIIGGPMCRWIPQSRWLMVGTTLVLLAFSAAMITVGPGQESKGIGILFIACLTVGIVETCALALAPLPLPTEDIGVALGALGSIRSSGASVATAIYTTILSNKLSDFTGPRVTQAALAAGLPQDSLSALLTSLASGDLSGVSGMNPTITAAVAAATASAAADAFKYVWYAVVAFACVAVIAACFTVNYGDFMTDEVARKMHGRIVGEKKEEGLPEKDQEA